MLILAGMILGCKYFIFNLQFSFPRWSGHSRFFFFLTMQAMFFSVFLFSLSLFSMDFCQHWVLLPYMLRIRVPTEEWQLFWLTFVNMGDKFKSLRLYWDACVKDEQYSYIHITWIKFTGSSGGGERKSRRLQIKKKKKSHQTFVPKRTPTCSKFFNPKALNSKRCQSISSLNPSTPVRSKSPKVTPSGTLLL